MLQKNIIICKDCGREQQKYAKGVCMSCYKMRNTLKNQIHISRNKLIKMIEDSYEKQLKKAEKVAEKNGDREVLIIIRMYLSMMKLDIKRKIKNHKVKRFKK